MIELFASRLEAVDARLWVVNERSALPGLVRERVGSGAVVAWEEAVAHVSSAQDVRAQGTSAEWLATTAGHSAEDMRARAAAADVSLIVADVGIAETGQIGFAHDERRPREVALLPDRQIVLLERENLVLSAIEALRGVRAASFVLVAGPSRTADIEQRMMLGVHAPRSLDVIVFG